MWSWPWGNRCHWRLTFFQARAGTKYAATQARDTLEYDGLTDAFEHRSMGMSAEEGNSEYAQDRPCQDAWAAASRQRAETHAAFLSEEIEPFKVISRKRHLGRTRTEILHPNRSHAGRIRGRKPFPSGQCLLAGGPRRPTHRGTGRLRPPGRPAFPRRADAHSHVPDHHIATAPRQAWVAPGPVGHGPALGWRQLRTFLRGPGLRPPAPGDYCSDRRAVPPLSRSSARAGTSSWRKSS